MLLGDKITIDRNGISKDILLTDEDKAKILGAEGRNFMGPRFEFVVDSISSDVAKKAGLLKGDKIIGVNGNKINYFDELASQISKKPNDTVRLTLNRNNRELEITTILNKESKVGFMPKPIDLKNDYEVINKLSIGSAFKASVQESWQLFIYNIKQFKLILKPKTEAYKQIKSPIGIARILPDTWDWEFIWSFTALFSIGLAFMNLLPIPGLDGGHALFTIVEMITGKTLSVKAAERVQTFGMIILLSLMALTFGKDIYQLVMDKFFTN